MRPITPAGVAPARERSLTVVLVMAATACTGGAPGEAPSAASLAGVETGIGDQPLLGKPISGEPISDEPITPMWHQPGEHEGPHLLTCYGGCAEPHYDETACGGNTACCTGCIDGTWWYSTEERNFGCGAKLEISRDGRCVVVEVADNGPADWVEADAAAACGGSGWIIDASPLVADYFGGGCGYGECFWVNVRQVDSSSPTGPCASCPCGCTPSTEVCNGLDDDCNGTVDDGDVCGTGPNHCINQAGGFGFNCAGTLPAMTCVNVAESSDPDSWEDNHFCSTRDLGMVWSSAGPVEGYDCVAVTEGSEPAEHTWADNYLCLLPGTPYTFSWASAGATGGDCVRWYEPSDPHTWWDNFMCASPTDPNGCIWRTAGFGFSCAGPIEGMACVRLDMAEDPDSWSDNYFCADYDLGMKWSANGPIAGMQCTQVTESSEPAAQGWSDNYVCLPEGAPYELAWSSAGPLAGGGCVAWYEASDADSWGDNFMCARPTDPEACLWNEGGFAFNCAGPVDGMDCVNVKAPQDSAGWDDNYFCAAPEVGLAWSNTGPIAGLNCVRIAEPSDDDADAWVDNFLCTAASASLQLAWSASGPLPEGTCIRWYEPSEPAPAWTDNWLCITDNDPGNPPTGDESESGCACRTAGSPIGAGTGGTGGLLLVGAVLACLKRRRPARPARP